MILKPIYFEYQDSFAAKEFRAYGVFGTYHRHFFSFTDRFHNLAFLEKENEELKERMARVEAKQGVADAEQAERDLAAMNEKLEKKLEEESGSPLGQLPQTISYEVPLHLTPMQLHSLALGYFRKQEFEKSGVLLQHLLHLKEDHQFERAENYLINGISWFHLKDYKLAETQIAEAERRSVPTDPIHRKSMIWRAVLQSTLGKTNDAQKTLLNFVGLYPHSEESLMLNAAASRAPARFEPHEVFPKEMKADEHQASSEPSPEAPKEATPAAVEKKGAENHEEQ